MAGVEGRRALVTGAGSADANYLMWTYVGQGVTSRAWTVTMPTR